MQWVKQNSFISMVGAFTICFILLILITDEKIEKYEQIEVSQGDSLWSLADHYRGKMSKEQWISMVKDENVLFSDSIHAGQIIVVPVEKRSQYIAQQNQLVVNAESIKVVSEK